MPLADKEVVRVVGRGYLDQAGAELWIDIAVSDNRNYAVGEWQAHHFADKCGVALVIRMRGNGCIAKESLGA